MKPFPFKLKHVILPLALLMLVTTSTYLLVYWLLYHVFHFNAIKEEIVHIWLPLVLSAIGVFIFIRSRIQLLQLSTKRNLNVIYYMVAVAVVAAPVIIGCNYINKASGSLISLSSIEHIESKPYDKYFSVQKYYVHTGQTGVDAYEEVSGKHDENLAFNLYFVAPISSVEDTTAATHAWFAHKYRMQMSNNISDDERQSAYETFISTSEQDFYDEAARPFEYLERTGNNSDLQYYQKAVTTSSARLAGKNLPVLQPIHEAFVSRTGTLLPWFFYAMLIGITFWTIIVAIPKLNELKTKELLSIRVGLLKQLEASFATVKLSKGIVVTPALIALNLLVYLWMVFQTGNPVSFTSEQLIASGANYGPLTLNGGWWRLFSCQFIHSGFPHFLMNMIVLYLIGNILEKVVGSKYFAALYLLTGTAASFVSLFFNTGVVSVGASGAIMGVTGVLFACCFLNVFSSPLKKAYLSIVAGTGGVTLVYGLLTPSVDNAAHIGGALAGIICGAFMVRSKRIKAEIKETEKQAMPAEEVV